MYVREEAHSAGIRVEFFTDAWADTPHHCWIHWLYISLPLISSITVSLQDRSNNLRSSFGIPRTLKPSAHPGKLLIQLCWSIVKAMFFPVIIGAVLF